MQKSFARACAGAIYVQALKSHALVSWACLQKLPTRACRGHVHVEFFTRARKGQLHVRAEVNLVNAPGSHLRKYTHADVICMCTLKSIVYAHISHLGVHTEIKRARTPMITRTRPIRTPVHLHVHIISIHELPTSLVGQKL